MSFPAFPSAHAIHGAGTFGHGHPQRITVGLGKKEAAEDIKGDRRVRVQGLRIDELAGFVGNGPLLAPPVVKLCRQTIVGVAVEEGASVETVGSPNRGGPRGAIRHDHAIIQHAEDARGVVVFAGLRAREGLAVRVLAHGPCEAAIGVPSDHARRPAAEAGERRIVPVCRRGAIGGDDLIHRAVRAACDAATLRAIQGLDLGGPPGLGGFAAVPIPAGGHGVRFGEIRQHHPGRAFAVPRVLTENHVPVFVHVTGCDADAGRLALRLDGMKTKLVRLEFSIAIEIGPSVSGAELREIELLLRHGIQPGLRSFLFVANDARDRRRHKSSLFRV